MTFSKAQSLPGTTILRSREGILAPVQEGSFSFGAEQRRNPMQKEGCGVPGKEKRKPRPKYFLETDSEKLLILE